MFKYVYTVYYTIAKPLSKNQKERMTDSHIISLEFSKPLTTRDSDEFKKAMMLLCKAHNINPPLVNIFSWVLKSRKLAVGNWFKQKLAAFLALFAHRVDA